MKWKTLHFLLSCVNENFKNQLLIDAELIQGLSKSQKKVNPIVKANEFSLVNSWE